LNHTGLQQVGNNSGPMVMPNPNNGIFNVTLPNGISTANISVFDGMARKIYRFVTTNKTTNIDLTSVEKGIYLLQVDMGVNRYNTRIVIQ
jgi:hypothetical protein